MRYIDSDALIKAIRRGGDFTRADLLCILDDIPTADVVEVRHGYWVRNEDRNAYESEHFCSVCLADGSYDVSYEKYCYNCGAKMDGGIEK